MALKRSMLRDRVKFSERRSDKHEQRAVLRRLERAAEARKAEATSPDDHAKS
jgi:hypothetical protein